jgi:hypothetical protein
VLGFSGAWVLGFGFTIELDEFLTFWAMEVLTGHWDGMTGNRDNTFMYHDPADGRFHAIPWGTAGALAPHPFIPDAPASVYAYNSLSSRLYRPTCTGWASAFSRHRDIRGRAPDRRSRRGDAARPHRRRIGDAYGGRTTQR